MGILSAATSLAENIKWNGSNYHVEGEGDPGEDNNSRQYRSSMDQSRRLARP